MFSISVPPYIDPTASSQDNITVVENQQLIINCPISGVPLPNITWYKDGDIISPDSHVTITFNGRRLSVKDTRVDNSGYYRCVGENVAGNMEKIFSVKVHGKKIYLIVLYVFMIENIHEEFQY